MQYYILINEYEILHYNMLPSITQYKLWRLINILNIYYKKYS